MSYSEALLRHFHEPRNNHVMRDPDAVGVAGAPGYGPFLVLYLRLDGASRIFDAAFQTHGCAPSIAAGSLLATELPGTTLADALASWTEEAIDAALGGVPVHKRHCPALAAAALRAACRAASQRRPADERSP